MQGATTPREMLARLDDAMSVATQGDLIRTKGLATAITEWQQRNGLHRGGFGQQSYAFAMYGARIEPGTRLLTSSRRASPSGRVTTTRASAARVPAERAAGERPTRGLRAAFDRAASAVSDAVDTTFNAVGNAVKAAGAFARRFAGKVGDYVSGAVRHCTDAVYALFFGDSRQAINRGYGLRSTFINENLVARGVAAGQFTGIYNNYSARARAGILHGAPNASATDPNTLRAGTHVVFSTRDLHSAYAESVQHVGWVTHGGVRYPVWRMQEISAFSSSGTRYARNTREITTAPITGSGRHTGTVTYLDGRVSPRSLHVLAKVQSAPS